MYMHVKVHETQNLIHVQCMKQESLLRYIHVRVHV